MTAIKNKMESNAAYKDVELNYDIIELLKIIKEIAFKSRDKKYNYQLAFFCSTGSN